MLTPVYSVQGLYLETNTSLGITRRTNPAPAPPPYQPGVTGQFSGWYTASETQIQVRRIARPSVFLPAHPL